MKRLIGLFGLLLLAPTLVAAQSVVTKENYTWYWDGMVWDDDDTVGCLGEALVVTGPIHVVLHETTDASGAYHFKYHFQPQHVSVVGQTSGDEFKAVGVTQGYFKLGGVNYPLYVETYINHGPVVKPGTGMALDMFWRFHITINANGDTSAYLELLEVKCRE